MKNQFATLPLDSGTAGLVAVIGPNANLSRSNAGYYGPMNVCGSKFWTLVDAVANGGEVETVSVLGVPDPQSEDRSGISEAAQVARGADTVVLAVGTDLNSAKEGHDANSISLTEAQEVLIEQVADVAKKPVIVVVMKATPLDLSNVLANPKVGAVLHLGQPSVTVLGVSELLYGEISPAGRMIQTVYESSYQNQISIFDFNMRFSEGPRGSSDHHGHELQPHPVEVDGPTNRT